MLVLAHTFEELCSDGTTEHLYLGIMARHCDASAGYVTRHFAASMRSAMNEQRLSENRIGTEQYLLHRKYLVT